MSLSLIDHEGERKYLTEAERWLFFEHTEQEPHHGKRLYMQVLFYTGCRASEPFFLKTKNLVLGENCLILRTLKCRRTGVYRSVPVPLALIQFLQSYSKGLGPDDHLFTFCRSTGYRAVCRTMDRSGLSGASASPRGLRHSFGVACLRNSVPLTVVKKWMGHSRLQSTEIYLQVGGEEERAYARSLWKPQRNKGSRGKFG